MDVTPSPAMFRAMSALTDAACGEAPLSIETSPAAERRRESRAIMMDALHRLVGLAMREGVARTFNPNRTELGRRINGH